MFEDERYSFEISKLRFWSTVLLVIIIVIIRMKYSSHNVHLLAEEDLIYLLFACMRSLLQLFLIIEWRYLYSFQKSLVFLIFNSTSRSEERLIKLFKTFRSIEALVILSVFEWSSFSIEDCDSQFLYSSCIVEYIFIWSHTICLLIFLNIDLHQICLDSSIIVDSFYCVSMSL